ncbi:MAG: hypothetical protein EBS06_05525 [Proteobacteria bacterium]|nr:hypothetical protein [Pseudomonadota bacterium]
MNLVKVNEKTVMSKPKPKIDMKEKCVESISIWKDVSELPENFKSVFIIKSNLAMDNNSYYLANGWNRNGNIVFEALENGIFSGYASCNVEKYCTLTDFINSFEQMQKDIEEIKRKYGNQ